MLGKRLGLGVLAVLALIWVNGCGGKSKPISVAINAAASTVDGTDTVTLSATVTNDKNSDGVAWTLSGPGALSGQSTASVTYTAPAATSSSQTSTITATSVADSAETTSATITVAAQPAITTTGAALAASVGASYSTQLAGSGGILPYTWAVTGGALPPCLTLSSAGLISGTVTSSCAGTYSATFTMTDSGSPNELTASTTVTITISPAPAITFNGVMPATATFGTAYTGSASATGGFGVLTYSLLSGSLPGGLALTPTSGAVTGTPTGGGTFNFTVKAADAFGDSATQNYQIVVSYPTLSITSPTTLPAGYAGTAYSQTLTATGGSGTGYTWTVTSGGSALTAVGLNLSSAGVLSGATPIAGSAAFGVQVKDSAGNTATATLSVTIDAGVAITNTSPLPSGYGGTAYSVTFAATGGSGTGYTWTVTSGASNLTAVGLSLSSAGVLAGTTPVAGSATFTVKVTDSVGNSATGNFTVTIKSGLAITTTSPLPVGFAGVAYSQTFAAAGGTGTGQTWSVTSGASSLAAVGLSLSSGGVLSGATPVAGTASLTVQVKDSAGNIATGNFSLTINAALTITSPATLPTGYAGTAYSQTLTASGGSGTGYSWTVTSNAGELTAVALTLSSGGVLSGATPAAGTATFGVQVKDSVGNTATATLSVSIDIGITITTAMTLPSGYSGTAYSASLAASGGSGTGYAWTVTSGGSALTTVGLSLSSGGVLSGATPVSGSATFGVQVKDSAGNKATATFSVTIKAGVSITTTSPLLAGYAGLAYSQTFAATGGTGTGQTWSVTSGASSLTAVGLSMSSGGVLSGATPVAGTASFTVKVTDSASNTATATFSVTINAALAITSTSPLPNGYAGTAYSDALAASGGSGTGYTWSVTSGASSLTTIGLSLSSGGVLSGSLPVAGSATFTAKVVDSASNSATASLTVTIGTGLTITSASPLPVGYAGTAYSDTLTAAGGSGTGRTWSVTSGASSLTAVGLSLSSTGVLSGATPVTGTATFTAKVVDSASNLATATFSVTINAGVSIMTTSPLPVGFGGVAYSQTFAATGGSGTGYTWSVTAGGSSLTAVGLTFTAGGALSGATPVAGTASFTVQVKDSANNAASGTFSVTINSALTVTTTSPLPNGYAGTAYSDTLAANGGSGTGYTWTVTSGGSALTTVGLSLSSGGVLSGATPVVGTAIFGVQVKDSVGNTAAASLTVTIGTGLTITSASPLPVGYGGAAYSDTLTAAGGSGTGRTWSVSSGASSLAAVGLSLSSTGVLSGTTPVAGTATFTAKVVDSASNSATATLSVTINTGLVITSTSPLPVGFAGVAYSQTFTATGGTGTGLTWSVTSGASSLTAVGLSLSSGGVLTGATPVAGTASFTVQVKDSANNIASGAFSITINTALTITTTSPLPNGFAGTAYSDTLAASGGSGTGYTWTVTSGGSTLTTVGLSLSSGGVLSGTTPVSGSATFGVQVKDSAGNTATTSLMVTVGTGLTITSGNPLPVGYAGAAYSDTLTAAGGSGSGRTWTVTSGASSLTAVGLSLSSTGVLTGTTPVAGTATFTAKVVDSASNSATATISVTINAGVSIMTTSPLPSGYGGVAYSQTFAATGGTGTGYTWSVTAGASSLTAVGLSLSSGGVVSGATPVSGTASFTVQVKDSANNTASGTFSVTINSALTVTSTSPLPNGYAGTAYSDTLAASGGSGTGYTWSVTSGASALTTVGLSLSSGGVLSGSLPVAGSATFTAKVVDSASNSATASLTVTVGTGLTITSSSPLPVGYAGTAYSDTLTAAGGSGTGRTWSVTSGASSLTAVGLTLSSTGVLSGATPVSGAATFTAKVVDSASNSATATISVTINAGVSIMTTSPLPIGYGGVAYSQAFAATGGTGSGYTWTVTAGASSLTTIGLSLSSGGVLSGATPVAGTASFTVQVKDSANNTASGTFSVTINPALTVTTTSPLPNGFAGTAYSDALAASGGSGAGYTWTVTSGGSALTTVGLSLSSGGVLSGATPVSGSATFSAQVKDSVGNTTTKSLTVTIGTGLTITSSSPLPVGYAGTAYSDTLTAAGGTGTGRTWSVTSGASSLTAVGLSLSGTGVLSGATPVSGTATFTAKVVDSASNSTTATLSVTINAGLVITSFSPLPAGTAGVAYSDALTTSGGTGTGLTWSVTSGGSSLTAVGLSMSSGGVLSGATPVAGTATFTARVVDSANNTATATLSVTINAALTVTSTSPLPGGNVGVAYSDSLAASGGSGGGYSWTVTANSSQLTAIGLSLSSGGVLSGSSPTTGTASFIVMVTDSASNTATKTLSVTISALSQVSGNVSLQGTCNAPAPMPTFTVSINTTPVQTTTTDTNGNYSFASVPNGTYTITPSITGASSVFYPATLTGVTINNSAVTGENIAAEVGYTVTGTINYSGTATGPIYISLNNTQCGGYASAGTTINAAGSFTIQGVAPGTYSLSAWMDTIGQGVQNANDPSGTGGANVVVSHANSSSNFDTLVDPTVPSLSTTAGPSLGAVSPVNNGVVVSFNGVQNNNGVEEVTSYTLEWSTSSTFPSGSTSSFSFIPAGNHSNVWFLTNTTTGLSTSFVNGTSYYFRARGNIGSSNSTMWALLGSPTSVKIGAISTGATITGAVTIPAGVTIKAGAPLYVGLYSGNGAAIYTDEITSPVVGANNFSVIVPNGTYQLFAIIDQNNDGAIDAGDVSDTNGNSGPGVITVTGNMSGQDFSLPSGDSTTTVQTQYQTNNSGVYYLNFQVRAGNKLPVAAELMGGPNLALPVNMSNSCGSCSVQFDYTIQLLPGLLPNTTQSYSLNVTYSDGTSNTLPAPITGVLGASQLVTLVSPITSSSTNTPSFNWTYPANASDYLYQFSICCGSNNSVWQIPGNNSQANGFTSAQITPPLAWGVDPTDSTNLPSPSTLTDGTSYNWQIQTQDVNGNSATTSDNFIAVPGPLTLPTPNPPSLPSAIVNATYGGTITASGGVPPYTWTVSGLPGGLGYSTGGNNDDTVFIGGTPNTVTTISFQVSVMDSASASVGPITYTITVNNAAAVSLPAASTNPLGPGVTNYVYGSGLQASGGTGQFTFVVNGTTIPTSGTYTAATNSDGLTFSANGTNTLLISGTPTTPETVSLQVEALDSNNNSDNATVTYSVPITTGPNGANNARLNGTYSCLVHGYNDADGSKFGIVSSVVADGSGNLTGGVFDSNGVDQSVETQGTFTGTYNVGSDNNGLVTINGTNTVGATGTFTTIWALAATGSTSPASEFRMVMVNDAGTSPSGQHGQADCLLDTTSAFTSSTINGKSFIFDSIGADSGGRPHVDAGRFDASAGSITAGFDDGAKGGNTTMSSTSLTGGSYTTPSSTTGKYTLTLATVDGNITFAVYIVDAGRAFLIETVAGNGIREGHVFTQALSSFSNANLSGNSVVYLQGYEFANSGSPNTVTGTYSEVFESTGNGSGGFAINQSYMDDNGSYSAGNANGSTTATFDASNPGRVTINTGPSSTTLLYLTNTNSGIELSVGGGVNSLDSGFIENQTQTTFTDAALAGNYMFGMLPIDSATSTASVAEFDATSGGTATAGTSIGGQYVFMYDLAQSFNYAFDSSAPGTGTFLITSPDSGNASCAMITSTRTACTRQSDPVGGILVLQK